MKSITRILGLLLVLVLIGVVTIAEGTAENNIVEILTSEKWIGTHGIVFSFFSNGTGYCKTQTEEGDFSWENTGHNTFNLSFSGQEVTLVEYFLQEIDGVYRISNEYMEFYYVRESDAANILNTSPDLVEEEKASSIDLEYLLSDEFLLTEEFLVALKGGNSGHLAKPNVETNCYRADSLGTTWILEATWDAVEGADYYGCYMRNRADNTIVVRDPFVEECTYSFIIEPNIEYELGFIASSRNDPYAGYMYFRNWYLLNCEVIGSIENESSKEYSNASILKADSIANSLSKGNSGNDKVQVKELQEQLILLGYDLGKWGADGDFGSATESAVKDFQMQYGLDVTGIVDNDTWLTIMNATSGESSDEATVEIPDNTESETIVQSPGNSACPHKNLGLNYEYIQDEEYLSLDADKHQYSYFVVSRALYCDDCGENFEEIAINKHVNEIEEHSWSNSDSNADNELYCRECKYKITIPYPCNHNQLFEAEDGNFWCPECGEGIVMNPEQTYCEHDNYTVWEPNTTYADDYKQYNEEEHLKYTIVPIYDSGFRWRHAVCNDCGIWIELYDGEISAIGITDYAFSDYESSGFLENHTIENGICKYCGYEAETVEDYNDIKDETVSKKQEVMDYSIDFIERSANGKDSIYDQFFTDKLRKKIATLSEGKLASAYDFIAGDAAAVISTSQADYYVDTLMKQCAGINSDSKTISITPADFELFCNFLGWDEEWIKQINLMVEKWSNDRWTNKYGEMILDEDEWKKELATYQIKEPEWLEKLETGVDIASYLWDCLYDYHVYSTALEGEASTMIDSAWSRMHSSDLSAANLASTYIKHCETVEGRIAYILFKNANLTDEARDDAFDVMLSNPSMKFAYESSTLFNDVMFGTTDLLEANHGTYWSMQLVEELHTELNDCIARYQENSSVTNYNDCLGTYSLYVTYLISAYDGVLESIDVYSSSLTANMIGDGLTNDERALVEQWKLFMEWYADDIEYALKDNSIDAIIKQLEEID